MYENKGLFSGKEDKTAEAVSSEPLCCGNLFVDLQASVISSPGSLIPESSGAVQAERLPRVCMRGCTPCSPKRHAFHKRGGLHVYKYSGPAGELQTAPGSILKYFLKFAGKGECSRAAGFAQLAVKQRVSGAKPLLPW